LCYSPSLSLYCRDHFAMLHHMKKEIPQSCPSTSLSIYLHFLPSRSPPSDHLVVCVFYTCPAGVYGHDTCLWPHLSLQVDTGQPPLPLPSVSPSLSFPPSPSLSFLLSCYPLPSLSSTTAPSPHIINPSFYAHLLHFSPHNPPPPLNRDPHIRSSPRLEFFHCPAPQILSNIAANVQEMAMSHRASSNCVQNTNLYFAKQVIQNACGTQALLNIMMNAEGIQLGEELSGFKGLNPCPGRALDVGCRVQGAGCGLQGAGCGIWVYGGAFARVI